MQKLFKQHPPENFVLEINNLLAAKRIAEITDDEITKIHSRYGPKLFLEYRLNMEEFYAVYLNYCLRDYKLTKSKIEDLIKLKHILCLYNGTVHTIHAKIGVLVYEVYFSNTIHKGKIQEEDNIILRNLKSQLKLPNEETETIEKNVVDKFMNSCIAAILKENSFSPDHQAEWDKLRELFKWENLNLKKEVALQHAKENWRLERSSLQSVEVDVTLTKGEVCYYMLNEIQWHETRVHQGSPYLKLIDSGNLYITTKRIFFVGEAKSTSIKLQEIVLMNLLKDGLEIKRNEGKSPVIKTGNIKGAKIILEQLLSQQTN
jgi:hypothetical protein